jgi:hypothetical protein
LIKLRNLLLVVLAIFNVLEFYGAMYVGGDWIFIVGTNGVLLLVIIFINVFEWKINKDLQRREHARLKN